MKLVELVMTNFMPYKGDARIAFPQDRDRNVMLVFGDNMRGKTSLLNALRWVFYGKALGRHSREIPLHELLNKEAALEGVWTMEVCVTFQADGHNYELRRRAVKRTMVAKPTRPEDFEVARALRRDGMVFPDNAVDLEINKIAPEQTSRFFLFDGELLQEYESLLIDGSEQGRKIKAAIEQALGVPSLTRGRDDCQTLLRAAQIQQGKDLAKMEGFEKQSRRQDELTKRRESKEADLTQLRETLSQTRRDRDDLDDFIEKTESIHEAKTLLTACEGQLRQNKARQEEQTQRRLLLIHDAWREMLRPRISLRRDHVMQDHERIAEEIGRRAEMQGRAERLRQAMRALNCPECGQPMHGEQRERAARELGELEVALSSLKVDAEAMREASAIVRDLDKLLRPTKALSISEIDLDLGRLSVQQTTLENQIAELEDSIRGQDTAEMAHKRARRDALVKEEGRLEKSVKDTEDEINRIGRDVEMIARTLAASPAAAKTRSSRMVKVAGDFERAFARGIDRLREDLKGRVQALASEAFTKLTTQSGYSCLRINNNYGLTILDERGNDVPVRSAGAEQIVALSLIDGLSRSGRAARPIVMDTPFGRLDRKHRANILRYLPTSTEQLVLFVHEGEVDKARDLDEIASRVGRVYEINEVSPRHSTIELVTQ